MEIILITVSFKNLKIWLILVAVIISGDIHDVLSIKLLIFNVASGHYFVQFLNNFQRSRMSALRPTQSNIWRNIFLSVNHFQYSLLLSCQSFILHLSNEMYTESPHGCGEFRFTLVFFWSYCSWPICCHGYVGCRCLVSDQSLNRPHSGVA